MSRLPSIGRARSVAEELLNALDDMSAQAQKGLMQAQTMDDVCRLQGQLSAVEKIRGWVVSSINKTKEM